MKNNIRVIDDGTFLRFGVVIYDPTGDPCTVDLNLSSSHLLAQNTSEIAVIANDFVKAVSLPVLRLEDLFCEIVE